MDELTDVLLHPTRWAANASDLRPSTRIYLALGVFAVTLLGAFIAGWLSSRWAHKRTGKATTAGNERTILRFRRSLILLVVVIGSYLAVELAPLPVRLADWLSGALFVLGALVCARLAIRVVALLLTSSVTHVAGAERTRLEREYVPLAEKATSLAVAFIFVIVVAKHFGRDVTSLVAALGVGSLAIGLAAQQTLGNMIAGFVLLVDRPFRPGDRVKLATGEVGDVQLIGVRSTRIRLVDGNTLTAPNAELANSRVVKFTIATTHSDVKIPVAANSDVERVAAIFAAAIADDKRIVSSFVRLSNVSDRGLEFTIGIDCATPGESWLAEEQLRRRALARLKAEKIELPDFYRSSQGVPSGSPV